MGELSLDVKRKPDANCLECGLWKLCKSPIMKSDGPEEGVIWLGVGEAPGKDEDTAKDPFPFQGRAGQLLREAMEEAGFDMKYVRLSNAVKCRPPHNDLKAYPDAADLCRPKILREIHVIRPKVVILFGAVALYSVLRKKGIIKLNGEVFKLNDRYYVPCVHPAFVLRDPGNMGKLMKALKMARRLGKREHTSEKKNYITIRDKQTLYEMTDLLKKQKRPVAGDIESSTLSPFEKRYKPELGCMAFSPEKNFSILYPIYAREGEEGKIHFRPETGLEALKEVCESDLDLIFHFGKFDVGYLELVHGIFVKHYWYDTGIASYALNELPGIHGLKDWAWRVGMGEHEQEKIEWQRAHAETDPECGGNSNLIPGRIYYPYCMGDTDATIRVFEYTYPELIKQGLYDKPFKFPLMYHNWTARQLEKNGIALDMGYNSKLLDEFPDQMKGLEKELKRHHSYHKLYNLKLRDLIKSRTRKVLAYKRPVKDPQAVIKEQVEAYLEKLEKEEKDLVNLGSPEDKQTLIYGVLGYEPRHVTGKKGAPSTRMEHLEEMQLVRPHPVLDLVINRTKYGSSYSKYVKPIRDWEGTDHRTHTNYLVHGQVTGRVSSEKPNHENLPKRPVGPLEEALVKMLRTQFRATNDDYILGEADEKQVEMRLFCDRAHDDVMLSEFLAFKDPHKMGAAAGFGIKEEEVTKEQRHFSKSAISFGLLYGRWAKALAKSMGWSIERAQEFIDRYFAKYDDCLKYRKHEEKRIKREKFALSHFGRVRRLPMADSEDEFKQGEAIRQGINAPIQGDASDITWCAGYRLQKWLLKYRMKTKVVAAVHDALYTDIYRKEAMDVLEMKYKFMTDRKWLEDHTGWYCEVPLDIDISLGPNLGHMTELGRITQGEFDYEIPTELAA